MKKGLRRHITLLILQDEATEDIEKMAAIVPSEKPYLKQSVFELERDNKELEESNKSKDKFFITYNAYFH